MVPMYSDYTIKAWHFICVLFISIFGITGNVIVLKVYSRSKNVSKESPFNIYLCALAIVDLFICIVIIPDYLLRTDIFVLPGGTIGLYICKFVMGGIPFWILEVSLYLLVAICLERRKAILHSFNTLDHPPVILNVACVFS